MSKSYGYKYGSVVECSPDLVLIFSFRNLAKTLGKTIAGAKKVKAEKEAKKQVELEERRAQGRAEKKGGDDLKTQAEASASVAGNAAAGSANGNREVRHLSIDSYNLATLFAMQRAQDCFDCKAVKFKRNIQTKWLNVSAMICACNFYPQGSLISSLISPCKLSPLDKDSEDQLDDPLSFEESPGRLDYRMRYLSSGSISSIDLYYQFFSDDEEYVEYMYYGDSSSPSSEVSVFEEVYTQNQYISHKIFKRNIELCYIFITYWNKQTVSYLPFSCFQVVSPDDRNAPQKPPSLASWADDDPEVPGNPLVLKVFGLSPCGTKKVPITKTEWTGTLLFKWNNLQKKATAAHVEAKKKNQINLPVRPIITKIFFSPHDNCVIIDPFNDQSMDWALQAVKSPHFVLGVGGNQLRRHQAFTWAELAPTLTIVARLPEESWKWDHGGRKGDECFYTTAFSDFLDWNTFPPQSARIDKVKISKLTQYAVLFNFQNLPVYLPLLLDMKRMVQKFQIHLSLTGSKTRRPLWSLREGGRLHPPHARGGPELVDTGYVVTHAGAADTDPRVVILPHNGKKEDFARMKECTAQLIEKLFLRRG